MKKHRVKYGSLRKLYEAALVSETDDCIIWPTEGLKARTRAYPTITIDGQKFRVNRLICEKIHGAPFPGAQAAHSCDNRLCVNPKHISWKTNAENARDRYGKFSFAKLSEKDVRSVRRRHASGVPVRLMAEEHQCSDATIYAAISGLRYGWVS